MKAILDIIALAEEQDIHLVFLETPKYEKVVKSKNYIQLMLAYYKLLQEEKVEIILDSDIINVIEVNGNYSYGQGYLFEHFHANFFTDGVHLSREGRRVFTNALASCL